MRPDRAIHTQMRGARWVNRREGSARSIGLYDTKAEAVAAGRQIARDDRVEHVVHRPDGLIEEITVSSR